MDMDSMMFAKWYTRLFFKLMPGTMVTVKWPAGDVVVGPTSRNWSGVGPYYEEVFSADPNDHYRPWLEDTVGKQSIDWDWALKDYDATNNTLTIKFRKGKEKYAIIAALRWS